MDLEELQAFMNVVKVGSFHAAAETLGMSRTTLRRRVDSLQSRAGVPLLESSREGVILTEAGRMLAEKGKVMVEEASALISSVRELGREPSGVLRVVMPVGMPPQIFTQVYAALRSAYPRLHVHGRFSNDPLGESLVDVDMAVHFGENRPRGPWLSQVVLRVREWLVASEAYLSQRGVPKSIADLADHELLTWEKPGEDPRAWPILKGGTFEVEPALIATDSHVVRKCCTAGLGIALVPDAMLEAPQEEALVPVLPDVVGREQAVRVSVPEAIADIPKIKVVLTHLRKLLGALKTT
ncbi:MAG: LysR family transcriptional regulator [Myxococcaceae bacterium]|nr:LysR family transcriptional regulator [Myxococcaceae bacterium]